MIRRPPRSTLDRSSAASDVYKRQSAKSEEPPSIVHQDLSTTDSVIRDLLTPDISKVFVDQKKLYKQIKGYVPVSYTHLRAHETVLDLVCRLLLEKKKKQNLNYTSSV